MAGRFYPADPDVLATEVDGFLDAARAAKLPARAIVVPHAAYMYSGRVAAEGYACVRSESVERVVVIGPAHFVPLVGVAAPESDAFATPLGDAVVDPSMRDAVSGRIEADDYPHGPEHSIEVQLPFIRRRFGAVPVLPLVFGRVDAADAADLLDSVWDEATLVVCSTDLSHYMPGAIAREVDRRTAEAVCRRDAEAIASDDACGAAPLRALLVASRRRGYDVDLLDLRTSADAGGDADRVVGYGAFAVTGEE